jgi:hypothetical protein
VKWDVYYAGRLLETVTADGLKCEDGALIFWINAPVQIPGRDPTESFSDVSVRQVTRAFAPGCWTSVAATGE